jgi:hypothetical protein
MRPGRPPQMGLPEHAIVRQQICKEGQEPKPYLGDI